MKKGSNSIISFTAATLLLAACGIWTSILPTTTVNAQRRQISNTLKRGMSGSQVSNLVEALAETDYLNAKDVTNVKGNYIYDETVEHAVEHFQRDLGLRQDGVYDTALDDILFSFWRPELTSCRLGKRKLSASNPKAGPDVDVLIDILNEAGFPPDPKKLKHSEKTEYTDEVKLKFAKAGSAKGEEISMRSHHYYSKDIEKALMAFQAFHGIKPTGELNSTTLKALKDSYLRIQEKKPSSYDARPVGLENK